MLLLVTRLYAQGKPDIAWMAGGVASVASVAYSPAGDVAAAADWYSVKLWRTSDWTLLRTIPLSWASVAFLPDGKTLVTGGIEPASGRNLIQFWQVADGTLLRTLETQNGTSSLSVSSDGGLLAVGSGLDIRVLRVADGSEVRTLSEGCNYLAFSPDGRFVAATRGDLTRVWRISDGEAAFDLPGRSAAYSPDGSLVATADPNGSARLWHAADGTPVRGFAPQAEDLSRAGAAGFSPSRVAFSPDGRFLAVAAGGGNTLGYGPGVGLVWVWHLADGSIASVSLVDSDQVSSLAYASDGQTLLVCGGGFSSLAHLFLVPVSSGSVPRRVSNYHSPVRALAFSPSGDRLAAGGLGYGDVLSLWRASDGSLIDPVAGWNAYSVAFSPSGILAYGSSRFFGDSYGNVSIKYTKPDGTLGTTDYYPHGWSVNALAFSPNGSIVASGANHDNSVILWQVPEGGPLRTLTGHRDYVSTVAFSPDGTMLASGTGWGSNGSVEKSIKLWRVADGTELRTITGHDSGISSIAFSPDGQLLASASGDSTIKMWRVSDGTLIRTLTGHTSYVNAIAFSPDGQYLLSGSSDKTLRFWRVSDGTPVATFDQETGSGVEAVAFSPDGSLIAYGRSDAVTVVARNPFGARTEEPLPGTALHLTTGQDLDHDGNEDIVEGVVCDNLTGMDESLKNRLVLHLSEEYSGATEFSWTLSDQDPNTNDQGEVKQGNNGALYYYPPDEYNNNQVPQDMVRDITKPATRLVMLTLHFTTNKGKFVVSKDIVLARPPVVLVHGINSGPDRWVPFKDFVTTETVPGTSQIGLGIDIPLLTVNHSNHLAFPGGLFNGNGAVELGANLLSRRIKDTLRQVRQGEVLLDPADPDNPHREHYTGYLKYGTLRRRLAIKRVDVVAWSYGGVITRWYLASAGANTPFISYKRDTGFIGPVERLTYAGDVRKVITLGSMWRGVPLVNLLNEVVFPSGNGIALGQARISQRAKVAGEVAKIKDLIPNVPDTLGQLVDIINHKDKLPIRTEVPSMDVMAVDSPWIWT